MQAPRPPPIRVRITDAAHGVRLATSGPETGAALTLVCFPCAGGAASSFRPLMGALPSSWRVIAVDPPGHGLNAGTPLDRVERMVEAYRPALPAGGPIYLFGHSLGGLVAYLLASALEEAGTPVAGAVIAACRAPPHVVDECWSVLDDAHLTKNLEAIGGVPEAFRGRPEEIRPYLPAIRADFRALECFEDRNPRPIRAPMWVLAAGDDTFAPPRAVEPWLDYGLRAELHCFPGDHFFVQGRAAELARWLSERLR